MEIETHFAAAMNACGGFEHQPHLAVAVSGGSDSMAACVLARRWASARGGRVSALIIDHGLRCESASEAQLTKSRLAQLRIEAYVLDAPLPIGRTAIQEQARSIRYELLQSWCREHDVLHLVTGHHADDQRETLLQRLIRGSGITGLRAMAPVSYHTDVRLLRPLLAIRKSDTQAYLHAIGVGWVTDASNAKPLYQRNRLRTFIPSLEDEGFSLNRSLGVVDNMVRSDQVVGAQCGLGIAAWVKIHPAGMVLLRRAEWKDAPEEVRLRLLKAALRTIGGHQKELRMEALLRLQSNLISDNACSATTLNGCLVLVDNMRDNVVFCSELSRMDSLDISVDAPQIIRQGNWELRMVGARHAPLRFAALGIEGVRQLRAMRVSLPLMPIQAIRTFPAVWDGEVLDMVAAVPHMNFVRNQSEGDAVDLLWKPVNPLAD